MKELTTEEKWREWLDEGVELARQHPEHRTEILDTLDEASDALELAPESSTVAPQATISAPRPLS